jgi:hypothetical protein
MVAVSKSVDFRNNFEPKKSNVMNSSGRSRKSKVSVLPGSISEAMSPIA